ncbi:MAG: MCE family protein [Nocardiopsaceae bacterium]|nr:MCE family protein [Nocardiopsaceae bacterium]
MNQKLVRYQLIAFVLVTVLGIGYAMASYIGLGPILGIGQYHVSVDMPSAGGLYANASVTERGVTVGRVDDVHLSHHGGVVADISLNNGTKIPSDLSAEVRSTSAVGEQYLELIPKKAAGPYLTAGSVIPDREVSLPPSTSTVLANLNALLQSVPKQQLDVTINQLYNGFNGTGPDLKRLLDSSEQLLKAAQQNLSPTQKLIGESDPVLATQADNSANIRDFSRNLAAFTTQLRDSNGDLKGTLDQGPGLANQLNDLIGQLQPTVPLLLDNLDAIGQVTKVYLPNLQQSLVILPADVNDMTAAMMSSPVPGGITHDVKMATGNPSPCTTGYPSQMRQPDDTGYEAAPNPQPYCTVPQSSQQQVRGAHNEPCPNDPSLRSATAAGCGLNFGAPAVPASGESGSSGGTSATTYDPASGLLVGPNGLLYSVGPDTSSGTGPTSLQGLLTQTLGG